MAKVFFQGHTTCVSWAASSPFTRSIQLLNYARFEDALKMCSNIKEQINFILFIQAEAEEADQASVAQWGASQSDLCLRKIFRI